MHRSTPQPEPSSDPTPPTGVIYILSEVMPDAIRDGLSTTYLVGEKYLNADNYQDGVTDAGDNDTMYVGVNQDNVSLSPASVTPSW